MAELNFQDAVQTLRNALGAQADSTEVDGRGDMARVLRDRLGYTNVQADEMIDALINAGEVRYHRGTPSDAPAGETDVPIAPVAVAGASLGMSGTGTMGAAVVPGLLFGGHWQIGHDAAEADGGRAGQVDPTA